jgi:glycosyltransferase involved in cell wall biosynthesis
MSPSFELLYLSDIRCPLERANGIQSFETCHALATRGVGVTLLVRDDTARPRRDPFDFYGLPHVPALRVVRLPMAGPQPLRRLRYLASTAWAALKPSRHDAVYTRDLGVADVVLSIPRGLRPPLVYESHGYAPVISSTMSDPVTGVSADPERKRRRLIGRERRLWHGAEGYVTTTGVLAEYLRATFGGRTGLVATLPNGVRLPKGRTMPPPHTGPPLVGFAGHLYPWKGVDVLIRALRLLPDVQAIVVGGFPGERDLERVRALAEEIDVDGRVRFTGQVEPSHVPDLLRSAGILVMPTESSPPAAFTSPLKLFEYFASGRPVVASDLAPIREIVRSGENALLFTAGSPESLASSIRQLVDDRALGERLAGTAFDEAERYGWDRRAERLEILLRRLVT